MSGLLLASCVAPTFISYRPIKLSWDDTDYLVRAIQASRSFWSGDAHGLGAALVSVHTPIMAIIGLPWGPLRSWGSVGDCFFTLAAMIAFLAAMCIYMLLRIGVKPVYVLVASLSVGFSLGPYPAGVHAETIDAHAIATGFYADALLAWLVLAAVLLIPFEAKMPCRSIRSAIVRGIVGASIFSLGALTKVSFFYFIILIVPVLLFLRFRAGSIRSLLAWLVALACCSGPTGIFFARYGRSALANAKAASFGGLAGFYHVPQWQFLAGMVKDSPGLVIWFLLLAATGIYLLIKERPRLFDPAFVACLIVVGFVVVVLASPSKQSRYLFPAIVALPFLTSILLSREKKSVSTSRALLAAGVAFICLVGAAVPMRHRAYRQNLTRAEAVMAEANQMNAESIVLATDSPTLNLFLLRLMSEFSGSRASVETLAYHVIQGVPLEEDLRTIAGADIVLFQDTRDINPPFTNLRVPEYESFVRGTGAPPIRLADDVSVYLLRDPLAMSK